MIPLEDNVGDIIGKAQRGLGITNETLRDKAGLNQAQLRALKSERPPDVGDGRAQRNHDGRTDQGERNNEQHEQRRGRDEVTVAHAAQRLAGADLTSSDL